MYGLMYLDDKKYTADCGCLSGWKDGKKFRVLCLKHNKAFKAMKPYSTYARLDVGLCPICHGYDEVIAQTVCICDVYDKRNELSIIMDYFKSHQQPEDIMQEYYELSEDIKRVRECRGH